LRHETGDSRAPLLSRVSCLNYGGRELTLAAPTQIALATVAMAARLLTRMLVRARLLGGRLFWAALFVSLGRTDLPGRLWPVGPWPLLGRLRRLGVTALVLRGAGGVAQLGRARGQWVGIDARRLRRGGLARRRFVQPFLEQRQRVEHLQVVDL